MGLVAEYKQEQGLLGDGMGSRVVGKLCHWE